MFLLQHVRKVLSLINNPHIEKSNHKFYIIINKPLKIIYLINKINLTIL